MCWQILAGQCDSHHPVVDFVKYTPCFLQHAKLHTTKATFGQLRYSQHVQWPQGINNQAIPTGSWPLAEVANKNCWGLHKTQTTAYSWVYSWITILVIKSIFCWLENRLSHIRTTIKHWMQKVVYIRSHIHQHSQVFPTSSFWACSMQK